MTRENRNFGAEYGIEVRIPKGVLAAGWMPDNIPGEGFEEYETARQEALNLSAKFKVKQYRVVVYEYDGLERKNVRIVTTIKRGTGKEA